ncbi:hypothetical protein ACXR0O_28120 [Verrucomicrobiota bacterium sgz303538]
MPAIAHWVAGTIAAPSRPSNKPDFYLKILTPICYNLLQWIY